MAKPIRNTPILFGEDARKFREEIENLPPLEERRRRRKKVEEGAQKFLEMIEKYCE